MFWSIWSIMMTRPSSHMGHASARRLVTQQFVLDVVAGCRVGAMDRVVLAAVLIVIASATAIVLSRRRPPAASRTCAACERGPAKARLLETDDVGYVEVPWQERRDLHDRYHVADVPLIVL